MCKLVLIRIVLQISASKLWFNFNDRNLQCSNCLHIHLLIWASQEPFPLDKVNTTIRFFEKIALNLKLMHLPKDSSFHY